MIFHVTFCNTSGSSALTPTPDGSRSSRRPSPQRTNGTTLKHAPSTNRESSPSLCPQTYKNTTPTDTISVFDVPPLRLPALIIRCELTSIHCPFLFLFPSPPPPPFPFQNDCDPRAVPGASDVRAAARDHGRARVSGRRLGAPDLPLLLLAWHRGRDWSGDRSALPDHTHEGVQAFPF